MLFSSQSPARRVATIAAAGVLLLAPLACGSSDKSTADQIRDKTSDIASDADTFLDSAGDKLDSAKDKADSAIDDATDDSDDPCDDISADQVSKIVGFDVEGDGEPNDNGSGFVSCQFKAPATDSANMGATVILGIDQTAPKSTDEIRTTLEGMGGTDAKVTAVDLGDGGYVLESDGTAELRAIVDGKQVEASIVGPTRDGADLAKQAQDLAELVADNA